MAIEKKATKQEFSENINKLTTTQGKQAYQIHVKVVTTTCS